MHLSPDRLAAAALVAALALGASAPGHAESPEATQIRALKSQLEQSVKMIEELAAKVQRLEQGAVAKQTAAAAPAADQSARIDSLQEQVTQLSASSGARFDGIPVHGFADVGYVRSNADRNNVTGKKGNKGFAVGNLDLYLTPSFGDRVKSLIELVFEVDDNGELLTDLERVQVGYTFNDALTAWVGRFHTPYGYWNTAFHHGAQIQTSILRPRFLDFEDKGGILPAHLTGLWLTGTLPTSLGRFGYDVYGANAPRIEDAVAGSPPEGVLNMRMAGNKSSQFAGGFNAWIAPNAVDGLQLGLHGLRSNVEDDLGDRTRLVTYGGWGVYNANDWEVLGEYYRFRNRDLVGGTGEHTSSAWYAQVGHAFGRYVPFARIERTKLDQSDNYFAVQENGRSYKRAALGLRYDLEAKAALKLEWLRTEFSDIVPGIDDRFGELRMQYAIRF